MNFKNVTTDDEIKQLSDLAFEIWHEYWPVILSDEQINYMTDKFQSYGAVKKQIEEEDYIYNIFFNDGKMSGYFGVSPKENYLFLSKLYIKKDSRGLGCGSAAFNEIKNLARQLNKPVISLTVNKYNLNTINIYKKWGFKIVDSVVTDIGGGFVMDDYIMEYHVL